MNAMTHRLTCGSKELVCDSTKIMGILNVTPDSFSDGGMFRSVDAAVAYAEQMALDGADIIDIGGESTRPGSEPICLEEELRRVVPVVEELVKRISVPISIDTTKPEVAEECLRLGATMINDVSGLGDADMRKVAAKYNVPVVIMHMQGTPLTMQANPHYKNVINEIIEHLALRAAIARREGIEQIIIDPGIGFGKGLDDNLQIIHNLSRFQASYPIMVGPSRKGFIGTITQRRVEERLYGTIAAVTACVLNGAHIVRVHDVKECKDAVLVADAIKNGRYGS
ncbi:MAG: dihydropteroate synthase [Candidatus Sungbacteria bacterium]|nr:dihydropteroate synthase [Candidatus Sungbacteria bacterium]